MRGAEHASTRSLPTTIGCPCCPPHPFAPTLNSDRGKSLKHQSKTLSLAFRLERKLTSDPLLTVYMNHAYFVQELQGVFAASNAYFGKPPDHLTLAETATLAGLIR